LQRIEGDLCLPASLQREILAFAPDTVFHLGWYGVGNQFRNSPAQIDHNLMPSINLLRLAQQAGCKTWIGLGSQAEYGPKNAAISEDAATCPTTIYGAVKLATGVLGARLAAEMGLRFVWLRVFSVYGPQENPQSLIPYLIRALCEGKRPSLTGCEQLWDYLYAEDAAAAIYCAATTPQTEGVYNLGSGFAGPLRAVVEKVRDTINPSLPLGIGEVPYRPDQVMHLEADISRLHRVTRWQPQTDLATGLEKTVAWYSNSQNLP
jgi:nucleoside-diphosphate-sugar epimerase